MLLNAVDLQNQGFAGPKYIWCNNRGPLFRIWKRLDRAMVNEKWLEVMHLTIITHIPSMGSDHCPLLIEISTRAANVVNYFRFLNRWAEQLEFMDIVQSCWERHVNWNAMWVFYQKLQILSNTLSKWSRCHFEDIHAKVKDHEERIRTAEDELIRNNTNENRITLHRLNAKYIRFFKQEESILKQKSQLHWFKEGDFNTKYFHALLRGEKQSFSFTKYKQ